MDTATPSLQNVPNASSISIAGVGSLSTSLAQALQAVAADPTATRNTANGAESNDKDDNDSQSSMSQCLCRKRPRLGLDAVARNRIQTTFGDAIVQSQQTTKVPSTRNSRTTRQPPHLVLQGQLDHYNRMGQTWRIVMESATLKDRSGIHHNGGVGKARKRRRRVPPSSSRTGDGTQKTTREDSLQLGCAQILAFNDL